MDPPLTPSAPPLSDADTPPLRVLLVEDTIEQAVLLRRMLEGIGPVEIITSQDGTHAADLLRERDFDLLVTDLNLPGVDGFALARLSKSLKPERPVLAVTGHTNPSYAEEAFRAGADDVLFKPVSHDEFRAKVEALVHPESREAGPVAAVLAVGGMPGDVELGCGGTLLHHMANGDEALIVPLSVGHKGVGGDVMRRAAELLGARLIVTETSVSHADDPTEHQLLLERLIREIKPHTLFIPSLGDDEPVRREAHRISHGVAGSVPNLLAYETATTTPQFNPARFVDIGDRMVNKLEALTPYAAGPLARPDLKATFAQAHAAYWGRLGGWGECEPFEVLRLDGNDVA